MIKQIKLSNSNCYIITNDNDESLLVDTGNNSDQVYLLKEVANFNIKGIILTHGHVDQISNAKMISDIFNVPVYISKFDLELFDNQNARDIYTDGFMNKLKLNKMIKDNDNMISDKPNNIIDIVNGDTFSKLNFDNVKVISLPGHTRGSIGVLVNKKDLIVGDTLVNDKDIDVCSFYEEKASLYNSLEAIKDVLPNKIYPSVGEPFNYDDYFKMEKIVIGNKKKSKKKK
ncbi:MAG: MBL fold metallo-hydrolase [Clostridia bacterium]|nr:MBL fold metallo-hydrolase [Clostridia bacterium]